MLETWFKNQTSAMAAASGLGVVLPNGRVLFTADAGAPTLHFARWRTILRLPFFPSLALGEAYAEGDLTISDGDIFEVLKRLMHSTNSVPEMRFAKWMACFQQCVLWRKDGWRKAQSAHNIHVHYDLGNAFYRLFLDEDMQYSCGYFPNNDDDDHTDLDTAQRAKKAHIIKKLRLERGANTRRANTRGAKILDIGCGWGGMAKTLASDYGAHVTGITLSQQQMQQASARLKDSNLPVEFALRDYRDETGCYDRIVSVGMFEHVGKRQFPTYFQGIERLLAEDGIALIHTIGTTKASRGSDPFIAKYIFPGGYIPQLSEIMASIEATNLRVTDIEVWHDHYAKTLRHWRQRFMAKRDEALAMFDERFCRLWEFYLAGCEVTFSHKDNVVYQIQMTKKKGIVPITRNYLYH